MDPGVIAPAIYGPLGQEELRLSPELMRAVERCDRLLRDHGMQMRIICLTCHRRGAEDPGVQGNNDRYGSEFKLSCAHAVRRLRFDVT